MRTNSGYSGPIESLEHRTVRKINYIKEYLDVIVQLLGYDLTFDKFQSLSDVDRKSLIRDIKINTIIDQDNLK